MKKSQITEMSLEVLLNERHRHSCAIGKIEREVWETLKSVRTEMYRIKPKGKKIYKVLKARLVDHKTLEELGKELGVTRERIRQLEYQGVCMVDNLLIEKRKQNETRIKRID